MSQWVRSVTGTLLHVSHAASTNDGHFLLMKRKGITDMKTQNTYNDLS